MKNTLILLFCSILIGCDSADCRLKLVNHSDKVIFTELLESDPVVVREWLESNKVLFSGESQRFELKNSVVSPNDTLKFTTIGSWEKILKDTSKYVNICIIDTATLSSYFCDSYEGDVSIENVPSIIRVNLTDIKKRNWKIIYDGSE